MTTLLYCLACAFVAWRVCRSLSTRQISETPNYRLEALRKLLGTEKEEAA